VKKILVKLQQLEIIEYKEQNNLSQLTFIQERQDLSRVHLSQKKWQERKTYEIKKLNNIVNYINKTDTCRSQLLLHYFGEVKSNKCGLCDVCIIEKRKAIKDKEFKEITEKIRHALYHDEMTLKELCNVISEFSEQEIINIVNYLFENDKVSQFGNKYKWNK
jgi:ATP-dependent DNA helicase RecQ